MPIKPDQTTNPAERSASPPAEHDTEQLDFDNSHPVVLLHRAGSETESPRNTGKVVFQPSPGETLRLASYQQGHREKPRFNPHETVVVFPWPLNPEEKDKIDFQIGLDPQTHKLNLLLAHHANMELHSNRGPTYKLELSEHPSIEIDGKKPILIKHDQGKRISRQVVPVSEIELEDNDLITVQFANGNEDRTFILEFSFEGDIVKIKLAQKIDPFLTTEPQSLPEFLDRRDRAPQDLILDRNEQKFGHRLAVRLRQSHQQLKQHPETALSIAQTLATAEHLLHDEPAAILNEKLDYSLFTWLARAKERGGDTNDEQLLLSLLADQPNHNLWQQKIEQYAGDIDKFYGLIKSLLPEKQQVDFPPITPTRRLLLALTLRLGQQYETHYWGRKAKPTTVENQIAAHQTQQAENLTRLTAELEQAGARHTWLETLRYDLDQWRQVLAKQDRPPQSLRPATIIENSFAVKIEKILIHIDQVAPEVIQNCFATTWRELTQLGQPIADLKLFLNRTIDDYLYDLSQQVDTDLLTWYQEAFLRHYREPADSPVLRGDHSSRLFPDRKTYQEWMTALRSHQKELTFLAERWGLPTDPDSLKILALMLRLGLEGASPLWQLK